MDAQWKRSKMYCLVAMSCTGRRQDTPPAPARSPQRRQLLECITLGSVWVSHAAAPLAFAAGTGARSCLAPLQTPRAAHRPHGPPHDPGLSAQVQDMHAESATAASCRTAPNGYQPAGTPAPPSLTVRQVTSPPAPPAVPPAARRAWPLRPPACAPAAPRRPCGPPAPP